MPLAHRFPQRHAGFSLIAVSILITVAALIFVSVLPGQEAGDLNQKTINNIAKLEKVEEAMRSFMAFQGRRPCPADGQYAVNTANFGREASIAGTCTGGTPAAPLGPDAATGYVVGGVIPTVSLGLPDEYQYDEFGRRFTYVVDKRATTRGACTTLMNIPTDNGTGAVTIENTTGGTVLDNTMYAYISHGVSGYGAFPEQGSTTRINSGSTDTDMLTNSSTGYGANNFTSKFVQKARVTPTSGDTGFDELVWYRPDIKNTCCLGAVCIPLGFRIDGQSGVSGLYVWGTGDVNGDGAQDMVIGNQGSTYVVFGSSNITSAPTGINPTTLNGTNGFTINVGAANRVMSAIMGDINGDGYADIILYTHNGYVYIIFGGPGSWPATVNTSNLNGYTGVNGTSGVAINTSGGVTGNGIFSGTNTNFIVNQTGMAIGDVDGDGYKDLILEGWIINGTSDGGVVLYGKPTTGGAGNNDWQHTAAINIATGINGTNGFQFYSSSATFLPYQTTNLGSSADFDNDGYSDIIIASYHATGAPIVGTGAVFLIYGRSRLTGPAPIPPITATRR